ncbi:chemosensory receptor B [Elysia marginata]|uniref:Chemosensory receptor B n=1 Tax=Elysia marginata TaxID=1093978 RepID=A0AAV4G3V6_9GAST|nr:chemosensory receptor B [Elysia marginata]
MYPATNSSSFYLSFDFMAYFRRRQYLRDVVSSLSVATYGFATLANVIVILVFLKDGLKSTSNISFIALAVTDVYVSIIWTLSQAVLNTWLCGPFLGLGEYLFTYLQPSAEAMSTVGSWITAVITWERLCCVALPLKVN